MKPLIAVAEIITAFILFGKMEGAITDWKTWLFAACVIHLIIYFGLDGGLEDLIGSLDDFGGDSGGGSDD